MQRRPIYLLTLLFALGTVIAACGGPAQPGDPGNGDGSAPASDAAIERGSTMFADANASLEALGSDADFQASSRIMGEALMSVPLPGMMAVGPAATGALESLGVDVASSHSAPKGHYVWNDATMEFEPSGAAQGGWDASFEWPDVTDDGRDAFMGMSHTVTDVVVDSGTYTFLTMLEVEVDVDDTLVATVDLNADYDTVPSRCVGSETAIEVGSFDLNADVVGASMNLSMSTDLAGTEGSLSVAYDGDSATMSFSTDGRYQFAHETDCAGAEFGEPSEMSFGVEVVTAEDSAEFSVDLTSIAWATDSAGERFIESFDLDVAWTFDGADAITAVGSVTLDEDGTMVDNTVVVDFGDGPMPLDDLIDEFEGEEPDF